MSLSTDEQILRELRLVNAQLDPGKAYLKAFLLLVLIAIAFTGLGVIVNGLEFPRQAVHATKPVVRGGHSRPLHRPRTQLIKESVQ
jgi:hypothetical protein